METLALTRRGFIPAALALAASCSRPERDAPAAAPDAARTVRLASIGFFADGRLQVGGNQSSVIHVKGWLEQRLASRGVKVEWTPIPSALGGPGFNEALANKSIDFAAYGDFPAIIARAGGIPIKLVTPAGRGSNSYLVVPEGSAARDILDLKGQRIALQRGRPAELAFAQLIRSKGLTHADFRIVNIAASAAAAAVAADRLDAAFIGADAFLLEDKGVGRILWSTKGTSWKWRAELFAREPFIAENPGITQDVVTAYVAAAHWSSLDANRDEAQRLISRSGTPLSVVQRDAENDLPWKERWSPLFDDYMRRHYTEAVAFTAAQKLIPAPFALEDFFEPRFVDVALRDLGLASYWSGRGAAGGVRADVLR